MVGVATEAPLLEGVTSGAMALRQSALGRLHASHLTTSLWLLRVHLGQAQLAGRQGGW